MNNVNIESGVNIFKALADSTRLKIVIAVFDEKKSVSTISSEVNMNQSAVSHQLQILKLHNIVKSERRGKEVYYSLNDNHVKNIIEQVFTHTSHIDHEETI